MIKLLPFAWWESLLFIYLIVIGIRTFFSHWVALRNILIFPCIVTAWSVYDLVRKQPTWQSVGLWLLFAMVGCYIGWLIIQKSSLRIDKQKKSIFLPGTPVTLILIILFICTLVTFRFLDFNNPFSILYYLMLGLFTGIFIGRGAGFLKRYST